jgi:glycosyltransferase involved in cell wall biosynthesis
VRIALVAPPWVPVPPPSYGGTESVIDGLCRGLSSSGHEVFLYATGDSTTPVRRGAIFERAVGVAPLRREDELRHVEAAYAFAADHHVDIIHDHTLLGPSHCGGSAAALVVMTAHGPFDGPCGEDYTRAAARVPLIAISHHQASTALPVPIAAVIHHGIDVDAIELGEGKGGYALFLGRMNADKGVATACRIARAAGVPLVVAAKMQEPEEHEYFDAEVRPLLGGDIEYVGEVGGEEKYALLRDALALLNPIAWAEPFGMVMIEALASGTPVVGTPVATLPELVVDGVTGIVASPGGLVARLADAARLDRSACRLDAERRFSLERMTQDHEAVYCRLLAEARCAAPAAS